MLKLRIEFEIEEQNVVDDVYPKIAHAINQLGFTLKSVNMLGDQNEDLHIGCAPTTDPLHLNQAGSIRKPLDWKA
jgi:hypothetical protein